MNRIQLSLGERSRLKDSHQSEIYVAGATFALFIENEVRVGIEI